MAALRNLKTFSIRFPRSHNLPEHTLQVTLREKLITLKQLISDHLSRNGMNVAPEQQLLMIQQGTDLSTCLRLEDARMNWTDENSKKLVEFPLDQRSVSLHVIDFTPLRAFWDNPYTRISKTEERGISLAQLKKVQQYLEGCACSNGVVDRWYDTYSGGDNFGYSLMSAGSTCTI